VAPTEPTEWPDGVAERIQALGAPLSVDVLPLLAERVEDGRFPPAGRTTVGGAGRLLPAADGWVAVNLPRDDDLAAVPAWLEVEATDDPWAAVVATTPHRTCAELVERAVLLGLPVGGLGEVAPPLEPVGATRVGDAPPLDRPPLVADLSVLWAGPLCTRLLASRGAEVVAVERGARLRSPELDDLLQRADVVVVAARTRALEQLGLRPERYAAKVWLSITGYGRTVDRVAFGDDAAVAGGLVAHDDEGPVFLADAVADPLTGVAAAAAVDAALRAGGRWIVDAAMARVAAWVAAGAE
jgi:CoA-transferase family III